MSGLVHRPDDVPLDAVVLECHACGAAYPPEESITVGDLELRCPDCGTRGLIPHRRDSAATVAARFGLQQMQRGFIPIPVEFLDLELSHVEFRVLVALEKHRWRHRERVTAKVSTIATLAQMEPWTVKRALRALRDRGLLERYPISHTTRSETDLEPLWRHVLGPADVGDTHVPKPAAVGDIGVPKPAVGDMRVPNVGDTHAPDLVTRVPRFYVEEEAVEVEAVEVSPSGTRPASPEPVEDGSPDHLEDVAELAQQRDQAVESDQEVGNLFVNDVADDRRPGETVLAAFLRRQAEAGDEREIAAEAAA